MMPSAWYSVLCSERSSMDSKFDPMNDVDRALAEINGASDELMALVDYVNLHRVDELSLREFLNGRLEANMKRAKELQIQVNIKKDELEKSSS